MFVVKAYASGVGNNMETAIDEFDSTFAIAVNEESATRGSRAVALADGGKVFVGPGDGGPAPAKGQTPAKGQPKGARVAVRWSRSALEVPS